MPFACDLKAARQRGKKESRAPKLQRGASKHRGAKMDLNTPRPFFYKLPKLATGTRRHGFFRGPASSWNSWAVRRHIFFLPCWLLLISYSMPIKLRPHIFVLKDFCFPQPRFRLFGPHRACSYSYIAPAECTGQIRLEPGQREPTQTSKAQ